MPFFRRIAAGAASLCMVMLTITPAQAADTPTKKGKKAAPQSQSAESTSHQANQASQANLSPEQLALAERVTLGNIPCEFSVSVLIKPDPAGAGRFILETGKQKFFMIPVVSKTGAVRLEDPRANAVWLQLGIKSMLMDQKAGRRLADACVSEQQAIVSKAQERNPGAKLFDTPTGTQPNASGGMTSGTESAAQ